MGIDPLKDGIRSLVRIDFAGNVHKYLRGSHAEERYENEVKVLKELERRGCPYVPKVLEEHPEENYFVTTNCGKLASSISKQKADQLYEKLEREYGVRHLDAEPRNITYNAQTGSFNIIDFELAEILPPPPGLELEEEDSGSSNP
ncbi:MAG: serine/threonine protein phosphatase [Akkermansiaceae bacterium]|nr:serine/threonine protein phosphatase [Akkermansiaceae bacterium]